MSLLDVMGRALANHRRVVEAIEADAQSARYWNPLTKTYTPLSEFSRLSLATRTADGYSWERSHPREPSRDQRVQAAAERLSGGMPAYLVDDETWAAAEAEIDALASPGTSSESEG